MTNRKSLSLYSLLCILFLLPIVFGCVEGAQAPKIIDETFNPSQDSLYAACADLTGFGPFLIDKMTYRQYQTSNDIKIDKLIRSSSFSMGHWQLTGISDYSKRYEVSKALEKKGFKQASFASSGSPFKIGEIQLTSIDGLFWNDILVGLYVNITISDKKTDLLLAHYIEKYGSGRGKNYSYYQTNWTEQRAKENKVTSEQIVDEQREWTNGTVSLLFSNTDNFRIVEGKMQSMNHKTYYLVSGQKYEHAIAALDAAVKELLDSDKQKTKDSLSGF